MQIVLRSTDADNRYPDQLFKLNIWAATEIGFVDKNELHFTRP